MSPLSPLRILLLGPLSWAILIGGILSLWEWADRVYGTPANASYLANEVVLPPDTVAPGEAGSEVGTADPRSVIVSSRQEPAWPFLALGLFLTLGSFGGFIPIRMLLGKRGSNDPAPKRREPIMVERPDGTRLCIEVHGNPSGPTLIFTHGWSLDQTAWYYAKQQLGDRYRLVLWDLPGLGRSHGPTDKDWSLEKMARDLDAVVEHTSGAAPVYLVGHSIGGMISQTYARLYPEKLGTRVQGILLVHTTYTNPLKTLWGSPLWVAIQKPVIEPLNQLMIALAPVFWLMNWQSYLNGSLHITSRITSFTGKQTRGQLDYASLLAAKAWPAVVARGNLAMFEFDEQSTLPTLDAPLLMVTAESDRITQPIAGKRITEMAPRCTQVIVAGGHLGMWEFHDQVLPHIDAFVQAHPSVLAAPPITSVSPEQISTGGLAS